MFRIHVERVIPKNIDTVFDLITDHAGYDRYPVVEKSTLLEPGGAEPNGEGALRYIHAGGIHFYERITAFERPRRMSYLIERCRPFPLRHDRGDITLTAVEGGTHVVWESAGHMNVPIIGALMDRLVEPRAARSFDRLLECMERA